MPSAFAIRSVPGASISWSAIGRPRSGRAAQHLDRALDLDRVRDVEADDAQRLRRRAGGRSASRRNS
jgi:hypothetical protein